MREVIVLGTPTPEGRHIQFFRFYVQNWNDPDHQPTGAVEGEFTIFDEGNFGEERGWLCVPRADLVQFFSRIRKYKATISFDGLYDNGTGSASYSFSYDETLDLLTPGKTIDERYLPHGRCKYLDIIDVAGSNCTGSAAVFLDYYAQPLLQPGNSDQPFILFDGDPFDPGTQVCPRVAYSPFKNSGLGAWYLRIGNVTGSPGRKVDAQANFEPPVGAPPGDLFGVGWSPQWQGAASPIGSANLQLGPITVPGVLYKTDGFDDPTYDVTIDDFTFTVVPDTHGYFEYRDSDGNNPVWDIDDGSQLIFPIPKSQP